MRVKIGEILADGSYSSKECNVCRFFGRRMASARKITIRSTGGTSQKYPALIWCGVGPRPATAGVDISLPIIVATTMEQR